MSAFDIFNDDAFSLQSLTARVNQIPEVPTLIGNLNVFEEQGVETTSVSIEKQDESLTLVGSSGRLAPGETVGGETRDLRNFIIPHFQRDDSVNAEEVQNVRTFGTESVLETVQARVDRKMARHTRSLDFTMENLRLGAITGAILDKDGSTLVDIFDEFDVSEPAAVVFALTTSSTDVRGKCAQIKDAIEDALEGEMVGTIYGLCGDDFHQALVTHSQVEATYAGWEAAATRRGDSRMPFEFGGISFIRYHTKPKALAGKGSAMIADNTCRFVVAGVPELFITRYAPAPYAETVNTTGLPRYARMEPKRFNLGVDLQVQMNAICLCTRPLVLQSATTT